MKFSSKLVNFFTSKYYSNVKYNHSFAFLLRIFFERAAKVQTTVSNLGNVYRNSKWSDLKVQNIKSMHLSSFLIIMSIFVTTILILLVCLFRLDKVLLASLTSILFWPIVHTLDLISYLWLCATLVIYSISNKLQLSVSNYFYDNIKIVSSAQSSISNSSAAKNSYSMPLSFTKNSIDENWISLLHSLYKSKALIENMSNKPNSKATIQNSDELSLFLSSSGVSYINKLNSNNYSFNATSSYGNKLVTLLKDKTFNNALTLSSISTSNQVLESSYNHAISQNLSLANQTRWALKMSPISEKLARDNFNYTQAKSLLGSPIVNSLASSNNIWSSNNLSNLKDASNFLMSPNLSNLNHFEDSRSWSMKKMYFGLNTSTYVLTNTSNQVCKDSLVKSSSFSILSAYLLDYNLSYSSVSLSNSASTLTSINANVSANLSSSDSTIYQESFNNYLLSLNSTSLVSNYNNFDYTTVPCKSFTANMK